MTTTISPISTRETARILGLAEITLCHWRMRGIGPKFVRLGARRIGYLPSDISRWLDESRRSSLRDCAPPVEPSLTT